MLAITPLFMSLAWCHVPSLPPRGSTLSGSEDPSWPPSPPSREESINGTPVEVALANININTKENYIDWMREHTANDRTIDWEEKESKEKILHGHALRMGRWLQIGSDIIKITQTELRKLSGITMLIIPVTRVADKTHKEGFDEAVGKALLLLTARSPT